MKHFLAMENVSRNTGTFQLGPVTLTMAENDYMVLLGQTGSGKSTLLRTLAGHLGCGPGRIDLAGEEIDCLAPHRRRIGFVSQDNDLFPHLTTIQNVAFGMRYLKLTSAEIQRRVHRYLDLFHLTPLVNQAVATLSGGEQRRVSLARCLITQPRLLLLDEPLAMLDHNGRREMLDLLKLIHAELRTTTLHVTHDRLEAWGVAGRCAVIHAGKILQIGSVADVFRQPTSRRVAEFLGGTNIIPAAFSGKSARLPWGTVRFRQPLPFTKGFFMLRPEHIRLGSKTQAHQVSGRIQEYRDFGQYYEVNVKLSADCHFIVHTPALAKPHLSLGTRVYLNWSPEDVHAFRDDEHHD